MIRRIPLDIKIKKINENAIIPDRGSRCAAGYDLYACIDNSQIAIPPHTTIKISTGLQMEIPFGYFGAIFARSGLATKNGLRPANCVGVIDSDYRGDIIVALHNDTSNKQQVNQNQKIAQMVVLPCQTVDFIEVETLTDTDRGDGGFGSTGTGSN